MSSVWIEYATSSPWIAAVMALTLLGPALIVFLERRKRLPRLVPWFYLVLVVPLQIWLLLLVTLQPGHYCQDPLQHSEFRAFYVWFLPFLPLLWHMAASPTVNHPYAYSLMLLLPMFVLFDLTVGNEMMHATYQSLHGSGMIFNYQQGPMNECAIFDHTAYLSALRAKFRLDIVFIAVFLFGLAFARRRHR